MVTKNQLKHIASLHQKKHRKQQKLFIAEGKKVIQELLDGGFECEQLLTINPSLWTEATIQMTQISQDQLNKISALVNANDSLAVFRIPEINLGSLGQLTLVLDNLRDPGNLGTIIRLCDWFGIENIICSEETVDAFNPKVVQATMGSLARVQVHYVDIIEFLKESQLPILGTFMEGHNLYTEEIPEKFLLVFGNEANGIQTEVSKLITRKISIPRFGNFKQAESLNVATATAVFLGEICRKQNFNGK
jgi:TrmH family RNA methyltransferase